MTSSIPSGVLGGEVTDTNSRVNVAFCDCPYCGGYHEATVTAAQFLDPQAMHDAQVAACHNGRKHAR